MPTIEANVEMDMDIEVWCGTCGIGLCRTVSVKGTSVIVPACAACMKRAHEEGYEEGYDKGIENDDGNHI